jgi:hypothetical protein
MNAFCALIVLTVAVVGVKSQTNASGITTRYWDCCKPSCAWSGKATTVNSQAVKTCAQDGVTVLGPNSINACGGGGSGGPTWMCSADQPWAVNSSLAFGFAAANIQGLTEPQWCCACYELIFTSTAVANKKMVVQVTNTGGDLSGNHFDIQIPGGGFGIFNGCASQFPSTPASNWGAQYGGISSQSQCSGLPAALQPGCNWRWTWYLGADNPNMLLTRTVCPKSIVAKTGCQRTDDSTISYNKYASL